LSQINPTGNIELALLIEEMKARFSKAVEGEDRRELGRFDAGN